MAYYRIPHYTAKHDNSGFIMVQVPVMVREEIGEVGNNLVFCSFQAFPAKAYTTVYLEYFDGAEYHPHAAFDIATARLLSAADSGVRPMNNLLTTYIKLTGIPGHYWT